MTTTRRVKIGNCTVVIQNVPDDISDEELKKYAIRHIYKMNVDKAVKEVEGLGSAS